MFWILCGVILTFVISNIVNVKFRIKADNTYEYLKGSVDNWISKQQKPPDIVTQEYKIDLEKLEEWRIESDGYHNLILYMIPFVSVCFVILFNISLDKELWFDILAFIISVLTATVAVGFKVTIFRLYELNIIKNFYVYYVDNIGT